MLKDQFNIFYQSFVGPLQKFFGSPRYNNAILDAEDLRREDLVDANLLTVRSMKNARLGDVQNLGGAKMLAEHLLHIKADEDNSFKTVSFWADRDEKMTLVKGFKIERYAAGDDDEYFTIHIDNSLAPYGAALNGMGLNTGLGASSFTSLGVEVQNAQDVFHDLLKNALRKNLLADGHPYTLPLNNMFWSKPQNDWAKQVRLELEEQAPEKAISATLHTSFTFTPAYG